MCVTKVPQALWGLQEVRVGVMGTDGHRTFSTLLSALQPSVGGASVLSHTLFFPLLTLALALGCFGVPSGSQLLPEHSTRRVLLFLHTELLWLMCAELTRSGRNTGQHSCLQGTRKHQVLCRAHLGRISALGPELPCSLTSCP